MARKMTVLRQLAEAVGKRPSAALPSSLVTAAYFYVRLIPRDFVSSRPVSGIYDRAGFRKAQLASEHFPSASEISGFSTVT